MPVGFRVFFVYGPHILMDNFYVGIGYFHDDSNMPIATRPTSKAENISSS